MRSESAPGQAPPSPIALPKGGGAVQGIGETFQPNLFTGTGNFSVPIAASPGRGGFGPQLTLQYSSGFGNGPFGLGWQLALPGITRKTEKGLPAYTDEDRFVMSGAEDLVPALDAGGAPVSRSEAGYVITRYRPRTEGSFARIERWRNTAQPADVHWRTTTRENVTSIYGRSPAARLADPDHPGHIFQWCLEESFDAKGNHVRYEYIQEKPGLALPGLHERHRRYTQLYPRRILYGHTPDDLPAEKQAGPRRTGGDPRDPAVARQRHYLFQVLFDYGDLPDPPPVYADDGGAARWWDGPDDLSAVAPRPDPFSSFRAGFEIRTLRRCRRVLMLHHFREEGLSGAPLVKSTDFAYTQDPHAGFSMLAEVAVRGLRKDPRDAGRYLSRSLPPVTFRYSQFAPEQQRYRSVEAAEGDLPPMALHEPGSALMDIFGNGLADVVHSTPGRFFVWENRGQGRLGRRRHPADALPAEVSLDQAEVAVADLGGDGLADLMVAAPRPGFYEATPEGGWRGFRPLEALPSIDLADPDVRLVDLDGDGLSDILVTRDNHFLWYRSQGEAGFAQPGRVPRQHDLDLFPDLFFSDPAGRVRLADMSGDGLADIVLVHDGHIDYWPNLGHGRWGRRLTMADTPRIGPGFDPRRIFLADLDGTGCADLIYVAADRVHFWFNRSGNGFGERHTIHGTPQVNDTTALQLADFFGTGTTCLVWSYGHGETGGSNYKVLDFCGGAKPHLLVEMDNNMGATTRVKYASSTRFYLEDKLAGQPWITHLPFPVQVLETSEVIDHIGKTKQVTRFRYHHGYYDGHEREFRGFGRVDRFDTEFFDDFNAPGLHGDTRLFQNGERAFHLPPVETRTWFHTGIYFDPERSLDHRELTRKYRQEYYHGDPDAFDPGDHLFEQADGRPGTGPLAREAFRALHGAELRTEVYALDGSEKAEHPYSVSETRYRVKELQAAHGQPHGVFLAAPVEQVTWHYERDPSDPRISHHLTLEMDSFGNVLKEAVVAYGRRPAQVPVALETAAVWRLAPQDGVTQSRTLVTYKEELVTHAIDTPAAYRAPLPCETRTYELTGYMPSADGVRFVPGDFVQSSADGLRPVFDNELPYETAPTNGRQRRLIEHARTLYRKDDLSGLLPLGSVEALALPGDSYRLAFTPGLLAHVFQRPRAGEAPEALLPHPAEVLAGEGPDRGGYVQSQALKAEGLFPGNDPDGHWWRSAGRHFYSPAAADNPAEERAFAERHFFMPHRRRDPFGQAARIRYDGYALLMTEAIDALGSRVTTGQRDSSGQITLSGIDYRVLQPCLISDPNRNRTAVAFDALGLVTATALMGKSEEHMGDSLEGIAPDLSDIDIRDHLADPSSRPHELLGGATTRIVYDLFAFRRTADQPDPQPIATATLARENHSQGPESEPARIQHSFSYADGFGREIQKKHQAEPQRVNGAPGPPRWVTSGWTRFNNKGKPVRQYEPFFSASHRFEFGRAAGVSPLVFYDPVGRPVVTLHPDHTYEKVLFGPWQQTTFDMNDTVLGDPRTDPDIRGYTAAYFEALAAARTPPWQTWYALRQSLAPDAPERVAAEQAAAHAETPTNACFDPLGRPFMTVAHNKVICPGHAHDGTEAKPATCFELDIQGNLCAVRDGLDDGNPQGRVVAQYVYNLLGARIHRQSMEAGARWALNDATGNPIRRWDTRGQADRIEYDPLRRPLRTFVSRADADDPRREVLVERRVHGEQHPQAEPRNLRGQLYLCLDSSGATTTAACDFKGNALHTERRFAAAYRQALDWRSVEASLPADASALFDPQALEASLAPLLEADVYTSHATYDALDRPITLTAPATAAMQPTTLRMGYNEANLLDRLEANLQGETADSRPVWVPFITGIDYDAKARRTAIAHGNGVVTAYTYDDLTFRLAGLVTRRDGALFPGDCPQPPLDKWPGCQVQSLRYTYDAVGNLTHVRDDAQQAVFFRNKRVTPEAAYVYDALYRLIQATGREHLGLSGDEPGAPQAPDATNAFHTGLNHPGDGRALGRYSERYLYDAAGNLLEMQHRGDDPAHAGWTRRYTYEEASLIEPGRPSNRLTSTTVGDHQPSERYRYDAHGSMIRMPHLGDDAAAPNMHLDYRDQLARLDLGGGGAVYYVYDAAGRRVRKVWEKPGGLIEERLYFGFFELYRRRQGADRLTRETVHIMDGTRRIALVETRTADTAGSDPAPRRLIRYQFGNHLGSAALELDDQARIISYEEYTPYGNTSYQAVRSRTETPKRYRYTGKERDGESGLYYHGRRYYAPWLGRWLACDPVGVSGGINQFAYAAGSPTRMVDDSGTNPKIPEIPASGLKVDSLERGLKLLDRFAVTTASTRDNLEMFLGQKGGEYRVFMLADELGGAIPESYTPIAHSHPPGALVTFEDYVTTADRGIKVGGVRTHLIAHGHNNWSVLEIPGEGKATVTSVNLGRGRLEGLVQMDPPGATERLIPADVDTMQRLDRRSPVRGISGMAKALRGDTPLSKVFAAGRSGVQILGTGVILAASLTAGVQIGWGINQIIEGNTAEGSVDVALGSANLGLTIGTSAAVKAGKLAVEAKLGGGLVSGLAGIAAAGAITLAGVEIKRTLRGEKTAAAEAADYYKEVQERAVSRGPNASGAAAYVLAEIGGGITGFMASGQKDLWGLLD